METVALEKDVLALTLSEGLVTDSLLTKSGPENSQTNPPMAKPNWLQRKGTGSVGQRILQVDFWHTKAHNIYSSKTSGPNSTAESSPKRFSKVSLGKPKVKFGIPKSIEAQKQS